MINTGQARPADGQNLNTVSNAADHGANFAQRKSFDVGPEWNMIGLRRFDLQECGRAWEEGDEGQRRIAGNVGTNIGSVPEKCGK